MTPADPWRAWFDAARRPQVDAAMRAFYDRLDDAVRQLHARCDQSGRCCRFDSFGHRLYVTALEVAWVVSNVERRTSNVEPEDKQATRLSVLNIRHSTLENRHAPACCFQRDNLCTVHAIRPMGCRVFFCQQDTQAPQQAMYEDFLAQLKRLHADFDVPYRYLEWRAGLDEARAAQRDE